MFLGLLLICAAAGASAGEVVGWRTDWTGRYPEAEPPLKWATNLNVKWAVKMPSWANATPVLVEKKLFVTSEPLALMCLDADTGQTLWQATNHAYADVYAPEALAKMKAVQKAVKMAAATNAAMLTQVKLAVSELKKTAGDAKWVAWSNEWAQKVEAFKPELAAAQAAAREYAPAPRHNMTGWATPTPVSDGKKVWVLFGNGVVVCYDLDGHRQWAVVGEKQKDGEGQSCSPVLAGNRLVLHVNNLVGLDADTGQQAWKVDSKLQFGSPIPARIGDTEVVVSPNGVMVRGADGAVLAEGLPKMLFNAPMIEGNQAFFPSGRVALYELPSSISSNKAEVKKRWAVGTKAPGRHYASAVYHDGVIYGVGSGGVMYAVDGKEGKLLYTTNLNFKIGNESCTAYPSLVAAGKLLLVSAQNGVTVVVQPGPVFKELARNVLEPFRSTPVPAGKRLYIRTLKTLYCFEK